MVKGMINCLKLLFIFSKISLFAIGGAYSFIPVIEKELVEKAQLITREEFLEVFGMTRVFPGAISIYFATYTGYKIAGIPGVIAANLGVFIVPVFIMFIAAYFYMKYKKIPQIESGLNVVQLAVFSMIIGIALKMIDKVSTISIKGLFVIILSFILYFFLKIHPIFIILLAFSFGILFRFP
ncbi:MAG: hypothetical protein DRI22_00150 [Caldiserica bacterium]|nr:MAG: hypothetical protein DRI22_00150 [Caldisericota bacterium]